MIEMIYKGNDGQEKEESKKRLPKNVRQIGEAGRGKKIYLEDYAVTYLHRVEAAVLLGEVWEREDGKYIFIHGAIQVEDAKFGDEIWEKVYREAREYFADSEILGWAMQVEEQPVVPTKEMEEIYKTHFDREDTVLLLFEPSEKEDALFLEENGSLKKAAGYYIYYDKNKSMQDYMVLQNHGKSVEKEAEISDKAIKNFRKLNGEKREKEPEKQPKMVRFLYGASAFLILTILVIGVTMMNNYDKMKNMELTLKDIANETEPQVEDVLAYQESSETESERTAWKEEMTESEETGSETELTEAESRGISRETSEATEESESSSQEENAALLEQTEGQEVISQPSHTEQATYTVQAGDTLADICRMYYGNTDKLDELCTLNGITDPNHILLGQKIKLP